jgi:hypothetical protein
LTNLVDGRPSNQRGAAASTAQNRHALRGLTASMQSIIWRHSKQVPAHVDKRAQVSLLAIVSWRMVYETVDPFMQIREHMFEG